jgi:peroxiredoxin Q/BCP
MARRFWATAVPLALAAAGCSKQSGPADPYAVQYTAPTKPVTATDLPKTFLDREGNTVDLKSYRGRPVVLVVLRGMPESPGGVFCAFCLAQTGSLASKADEFKARGAEVLLVFPGTGDQAGAFTQKAKSYAEGGKPIPYRYCLDKDRTVCDQLGVRGDLARPSTFIVDAAGNIAFAYVGKSQSDRPTVAALLAELDRLKPPAPPATPSTAPPAAERSP